MLGLRDVFPLHGTPYGFLRPVVYNDVFWQRLCPLFSLVLLPPMPRPPRPRLLASPLAAASPWAPRLILPRAGPPPRSELSPPCRPPCRLGLLFLPPRNFFHDSRLPSTSSRRSTVPSRRPLPTITTPPPVAFLWFFCPPNPPRDMNGRAFAVTSPDRTYPSPLDILTPPAEQIFPNSRLYIFPSPLAGFLFENSPYPFGLRGLGSPLWPVCVPCISVPNGPPELPPRHREILKAPIPVLSSPWDRAPPSLPIKLHSKAESSQE